MIDTVVLRVDGLDFIVTDPARFGPKQGLPNGGWRKAQNATAKEKARCVGIPALTWSGGGPWGSRESLRIECSVPKLLFGNNLEELGDGDTKRFVRTMQKLLWSMGVEVEEEAIWRANVSKLHVGINVQLDSGMTCPDAMRELGRTLKNANWDRSRTDYLNEGMAVKYHTNSREVTFYDKLADVARAKRSPKRAIDRLSGGLGIPAGLPSGAQVLRMECRFNTPAAVKAALKRVGLPNTDPRLVDVFSEDVSMKLLMDELKNFEDTLGGAALCERTAADLFSKHLGEGKKLHAAIKAVGLQVLEREVGLTGIRTALKASGVPREAGYRLKVPKESEVGSGGMAVRALREAIVSYSPFRLSVR